LPTFLSSGSQSSIDLAALNSQQPRTRLKTWTLRLLTLGISASLALVVAEVGLRAFNYRPATMDPDMYVANQNQLLPFKLQSNYNGYCAGREVHTDVDGNRVIVPSYAESRKGQSPERVVLLVGDSGVFGFGLSDADTIGSQMQRSAVEKNLNYEVRNIGVSGYTSWNEYEAIREYLSHNTVTNVVVLFMPNDLTFENDYFGIGKGKRASFDLSGSKRHEFTRWLYSHFYLSYLVADTAKRIQSRFTGGSPSQSVADKTNESNTSATLAYAMQALVGIKNICDEKKIDFTVGIYRDVAYYDNSSQWLAYEELIKQNLQEQKINWFIAKSHTDNLKASEVRVSWNDPHPSPRAAGLIAEEVLSQINLQSQISNPPALTSSR
jgi:hypothetical protein